LSVLRPLQSLELAMAAGCFSLLLARYHTKVGKQSVLGAAAACFVILILQHFLLKEIFPMLGVSLYLTITTGMCIVFALKLSRAVLLLLSLVYGAVFAASAYEILFEVMDAAVLVSVTAYIGISGAFGANVLGRISHPAFEVVGRVGASWIVAASILIAAFFV
jgi:hypothetical protein